MGQRHQMLRYNGKMKTVYLDFYNGIIWMLNPVPKSWDSEQSVYSNFSRLISHA